MTRHSFDESIENAEPLVLSVSHYALASNPYGLDSGHDWAFSAVGLSNVDPLHRAEGYVRRHLSEGGEWPYYIAATPTNRADGYTAAGALRQDSPHLDKISPADAAVAVAEGRVLETYCEGDLTAYVFESRDERDAAATAWAETPGEYAARVLEEDHGYGADNLGAAVAECWADRSGHGRGYADQITRDDVADTMEKYAGEFGTAAAWAESEMDEQAELARAALHDAGIPDELASRMLSVNWEGVAFDMGANGTGVTIYSGHAFRDN